MSEPPAARSTLAIVRRMVAELAPAADVLREIDGTLDMLSVSDEEHQAPRRKRQSGKLCACGHPARAKGLCKKCYRRVWAGKEPAVCADTNRAQKPRRCGGRPVKLHRCKWCWKLHPARESRKHRPECPKRPEGKHSRA